MATTTQERKAAYQKQIETLQKQMQNLDQEAIIESKAKLTHAKKVVRALEIELATLIR